MATSLHAALFAAIVLASVRGQEAAPVDPASPARRTTLAAADSLVRALAELRAAVAAGQTLPLEDVADLRQRLTAAGVELDRVQEALAQANTPTKPKPMDAWRIAKALVEDLRALGDDRQMRRDGAITRMRKAIPGKDDEQRLAALRALQQTADVDYDRAQFRPRVLKVLAHAEGEELVAALYALASTGREPGDLQLVHNAWNRRCPELEDVILHLLSVFVVDQADAGAKNAARVLGDHRLRVHAEIRRAACRALERRTPQQRRASPTSQPATAGRRRGCRWRCRRSGPASFGYVPHTPSRQTSPGGGPSRSVRISSHAARAGPTPTSANPCSRCRAASAAPSTGAA